MSNYPSLLPHNSTALEKALEQTTAPSTDLPVPLRDLWNPDRCPLALLPWLAWALSVDEWDANWDEQIKRDTIRNSAKIHLKKGTVSAVKQALADLQANVDLTEWFENDSEPYTFDLTVAVNNNLQNNEVVLDDQLFRTITRVVDAVKPVRSHYSLEVTARFCNQLGLAALQAQNQLAGGDWTAQADTTANGQNSLQMAPAISALQAPLLAQLPAITDTTATGQNQPTMAAAISIVQTPLQAQLPAQHPTPRLQNTLAIVANLQVKNYHYAQMEAG